MITPEEFVAVFITNVVAILYIELVECGQVKFFQY